MRKIFSLTLSALIVFLLVQCNDKKTGTTLAVKENTGGFESQAKWGEHIVTVSGCHDCHTPKKMTDHGPDLDSSLLLSGHIAGSPEPDANIKEVQEKGLVVTSDLTTWIGAWGTSYAANLTSDATGVGNWKEEQFMLAIRQGKYKGLAASRDLLPPMPWPMYRNFSDDELKAIFAYLKTTKPVNNIVPQPRPMPNQ